jgi:hypothetical protein
MPGSGSPAQRARPLLRPNRRRTPVWPGLARSPQALEGRAGGKDRDVGTCIAQVTSISVVKPRALLRADCRRASTSRSDTKRAPPGRVVLLARKRALAFAGNTPLAASKRGRRSTGPHGGCSYTPLTESGSFGPTVPTPEGRRRGDARDWRQARRRSQVETCDRAGAGMHRRRHPRGCLCPTPVVLRRPISRGRTAPFVAEQRRSR